MLEVLEPGLQSTVQDGGRSAVTHLGLRRAGAADRRAHVASTLLVRGHPDDAAIEMTLLGARFAVRRSCVIGLAGADMEVSVPEEGRALASGRCHRLVAGTTLACGGAVDGARTYLALAGGLLAERALGSASTDLFARLGGIGGRALRAGDILDAAAPSADAAEERAWPSGIASSGIRSGDAPAAVAVTLGPHASSIGRGVVDALVGSTWTVSPKSDRVGVRLDGGGRAPETGGWTSRDLVSMPMLPGAVQLLPDGRPIVLSVDAPTVGGYPVPLVVIEADLPVIGQLRPGDELRLEIVDVETARRRSSESAADLARAVRLLAAG